MARLTREQVEALTAAIGAHDHLRRVAGEIEHLHRVVFHANARVDWALVRRSAEQILIAEMVSRHGGHPDGIFYQLRNLEDQGRSWDEAVREVAAAIHSYFTTPLGLILRQDLFGDEAVFITPDAYEWTSYLRHRQAGVS